ncbi:hypothetical protein [Nesterenkonia rhizosphaerae]
MQKKSEKSGTPSSVDPSHLDWNPNFFGTMNVETPQNSQNRFAV